VCVDPKEFIRRLSSAMEDTAIYVADVGQNQLWSCANAVIRKGRFMTSGGMGTMGYALPASMGAKIAGGKRQVVAVCGDGGFQMTMMELATARQYGIQVKVVVLKNNVLGLVRQYQHFNYHDSFSVIDLSGSPELDKIAEAYGMDYMKLSDEPEMGRVIEAFLSDKHSVLLEVTVDPNEVA
ncbi:MAG: acetolactate synthase, large subunit, biosynthetic type, partial [Lachnospiraceae bacterium]|nr:acetolactate synthase, large subunit, biosynthetic type [Lachnospiraceae bacterium]